jgi:type I restriction enzyme R subunit
MTPHPYTEDQLVVQPAIGLFDALGWQTLSAMEETFGPSPPAPLPGGEGSVYFGRETRGEVVLVGRLRAAVCQLNPSLPSEAVSTAIDELPATVRR